MSEKPNQPRPMPAAETTTSPEPGLRAGTTGYRRATLAMLCAGLATFNALYSTQAILPTFVTELGISAATAALLVSAATGMLAICIVPASILSERFGRGPILVYFALAACALGVIIAFFDSATTLIALRALQGALIAGVPAVAMTWLSEEIHQDDLPRAMGLYIAGNTIGGLLGRLIPAGVLEFSSWRWAMLTSALFALTLAVVLWALLPKQQQFQPKELHVRHEIAAMVGHWRTIRLAALFLTAFIGMGTFVSLYNFIGFRMISTFGLSEALVGCVFLMYLAGTWSSARAGHLNQRFGRGPVMAVGAASMIIGTAATALPWLSTTLIGLFIFTAGFFAMHSTASSWVGLIATTDRAEASSMYLLCYYAGSSLIGWLSGFIFSTWGWVGLVAWLVWGSLLVTGVAVGLWLAGRRSPTTE
ncbi:MFS transporter [Corynebacterium atypicum]